MKKRLIRLMLSGALLLLTVLIAAVFADEDWIEIKVAKHIVKNSGVTKEQMEQWIEEANKVWEPDKIKFV